MNDTFLRGRQRSDADGMVEFRNIYPGWYPGRTVHIHLIVRTTRSVLTSQLYFPDDISDAVLAARPYVDRPARDTTNDTDEILPTKGTPPSRGKGTDSDRDRWTSVGDRG